MLNVKYLMLNVKCKQRLVLYCLNIEYGRHRQIPRESRFCELCDSITIEDEFHFVMECDAFKEFRVEYIPKYYRLRPSMFKFVQLLKSDNKKLLHRIAIYLLKSFKKRQELLNKRN